MTTADGVARSQEAMGHLTPSRDHLWMRLNAATLTGPFLVVGNRLTGRNRLGPSSPVFAGRTELRQPTATPGQAMNHRGCRLVCQGLGQSWPSTTVVEPPAVDRRNQPGGHPPFLCFHQRRKKKSAPPLYFFVWVTSGPNGTAGPTCRLSGDRLGCVIGCI
jgi:hypothetical protein